MNRRSATTAPAPEPGGAAVLARYPELALLAALLLLTAFFSRTFSQGISVGPLYVTEIVMGLSFAIAAIRLGPAGSWAALRRLPLPALAVIWLVGAIATLRGLDAFGFELVEHDIGLLDYTLLLPLLAVVAVDRKRFDAVLWTLVACGFVGMAGFALTYAADQINRETFSLFILQGLASGLYISFAVAWIAARAANAVPTPRWLLALAPAGLLLMALTSQRSVWLVALASLGVVIALAPRPARLRAGLASSAALAAAIVLAIGAQAAIDATLGGVETKGAGEGDGPQLTRELTSFGGGDTEEANNIAWRLAYWQELIGRTPSEPLLGVGFGEPAAFFWDGRKYDFRDGRPGTPQHPNSRLDVAGPHNSFVSFLYRLGIPAFLALAFVLFVAVRNVWRAFQGGDLAVADRVALTTLAAMLAGATMTASFNEALTGPFVGLFFWLPLGMLLLWPAVRGGDTDAAAGAGGRGGDRLAG